MRKFIIAATLITILLATMLVSAGVALADKGPYRPGDLLFPFQRFAEEQRPLLISSQTGRADYYLRLTPPYEPRNGPMPTIGDLRMVRGVDDATFMKLRNYLTVMPEIRVNANTASPEVLACLEADLAATSRLLVLDGAEHLRDEVAALVDRLLTAAPGLRIIGEAAEKEAVISFLLEGP